MEQRLLPRSENQPNFVPMNWQRIITILAFALALIVGGSASLAQRVAYSPSLLSNIAQGGGEREIEERMRSMSLEEQIGQLIIPIIYPSSGASQMARCCSVPRRGDTLPKGRSI